MAINYYANIGLIGSDIEFNYNELLLPVVDNETSAPATGNEVKGQMYMDTTSNVMKFYDGTAWVSMDGSGSGVSGFTNANGTFVSAAVVNTNAKGLVSTGVIDLSATGTPGGTTFLRGDNVWATPAGSYTSWSLEGDTGTAVNITDGLRVDFTGGTGISTAVSTATPNLLTITNTGVTSIVAGTNITVSGATGAVTVSGTANTTSLGIADSAGTEQFAVTDTVDLQFAASGGASIAFDSTNKRVTYTAPSDTNETYTLPVAAGGANSAVLNLTAGGTGTGIKSAVTINGTTSQIAISESVGNNGSVTVGLPSAVTIGGLFTAGSLDITASAAIGADLSVGGDLDMTGVIDMNASKIRSLASGTLSGDAVNLGQVETLIAGTSAFQGGYNAATNTPDLDTSPATSIEQGYFWAVTEAGTFFAETVQPGDLIFANQDNPGATFGNWTVVQSGQEVAGQGATDGATTKGIAGFDSATFSVTANGFVTSDIYGGASALGVVPSGGGGTTFLRGDGTWVVPTDTNTQRAAGTGLSLNTNTIDANVNATVQTVAKESVSATAGRTYELQVDSSDQLVVNVPWSAGSDTGVTSVSLALGASTGVPLDAAIVGRALNLTSKSYAGTTRVGYVPTGGSNTTFLRGDGTWVTPTDSTPVDSVTAATNADLDGMSVTPTTGAVVVGLDINSLTIESAPTTDECYVAVRTDDAGNVKTLIQDLLQLHTFKSGTVTAYGAITHSLGTFDVMVQIYDETTKDTIHMEVERNSVNQVTISGTGTFPSGGVIVLVSRMG
jgi:hypothetical protein|tara:strand:- start:1201 stop:3549 length:2349 start_codon:yes stop_codon:yes gene_type:complete